MEQAHRILNIYTRLIQQQHVNKSNLAERFNVNKRTIQRDIDNLRNYLYENGAWHVQILYDPKAESYYLSHPDLIHSKARHPNNNIAVTFEMSQKVFQMLHPYYTSELLTSDKPDVVEVCIQLSEQNALSLAFMYPSEIRIIAPESLLQKTINTMINLQKTYLNQRIRPKK